jgi:hypothetical protein
VGAAHCACLPCWLVALVAWPTFKLLPAAACDALRRPLQLSPHHPETTRVRLSRLDDGTPAPLLHAVFILVASASQLMFKVLLHKRREHTQKHEGVGRMAFRQGRRSLHLQQHLRASSHTALLWAWPVRLHAYCQLLRSSSHNDLFIAHPTASLPSTQRPLKGQTTETTRHHPFNTPTPSAPNAAVRVGHLPSKVARSTILRGRATSSFWPAGRPNGEPSGASYLTGYIRPSDSQLLMPSAVVQTWPWRQPFTDQAG